MQPLSAICSMICQLLRKCARLKGREDHYDGIIIDSDSLPGESAVFARDLAFSLLVSACVVDTAFQCFEAGSRARTLLEVWASQGKRGIWLELKLQQAKLLPLAVAAGFDFHHAKPGYAMLTRWLPSEQVSTIPENLLYNVGVGAFVLNHKNEVLMVQEASGILKGKGIWKFPTGLAEAGEDVHIAAEREVLEETGIQAVFDSVLAIRQSHGLFLGKSDLFFVCALRAQPENQKIVLQESELAAADWHPLASVKQLQIFRSGTLASILTACEAYAEGRFKGMRVSKMPNEFNHRLDLLIHGSQEASDSS